MIKDFENSPLVLKDFLNYLETIKGISNNTIKSYFYDLRIFLRFIKLHKGLIEKNCPLEKKDISDISIDCIKTITLSDLYSYLSYISRDLDNIARSRARKVASIKSFFKYLCNKAKILEFNPASELETPKIVKSLPRYLNVVESKNLLLSVNGKFSHRDYAIITLFLNCGLRLSELVSINLNSINNGILTILGKGKKERSIPLNNACIDAINVYLENRHINSVLDKNALFLSEHKKRISNNMVYRIVKKYIKDAGLDPQRYSTHKLRHTAATLMYRYGKVDIRTLQELLGHESIATTEIYTHLGKQQLKDAIDSNPLSDFRRSYKNE